MKADLSALFFFEKKSNRLFVENMIYLKLSIRYKNMQNMFINKKKLEKEVYHGISKE